MFEMNFTLQDTISALLGFFIFPIVLIAPGYVTGWFLDLFDFKQRRPVVRLGIGLVLSFAVSPIVLHLTTSLISFNAALLTLMAFVAVFLVLVVKHRDVFIQGNGIFYGIGIVWVVFVILSLIDIQWGERLFLSVTSYDYTTRVSVIDAMTRTGVPPINPSYYPGHPVKLTFLYYFWYILCSMVDALGGQLVDARGALIASSAWVGLGLMSLVALYLKQRDTDRPALVWKSVAIGVGLLAVSGLDILPATLLAFRTGQVIGSIDVWNTWIQSWVASALWVPHHLAALLAGMCAVLLAQFARGKSTSRQFSIFSVAGLAFASALGLSVYVTMVFVVFWIAWSVVMLFNKNDRGLVLPMLFAGLVAIVLAAPFLAGLLRGGGGNGGALPIMFEIRTFLQLESFVADWSPLARSLIMLLVLPINYLFELGFYFIAALYWIQLGNHKTIRSNLYRLSEVVLLCVVLLLASTLRSTLITSNDFGWRAWLPGQFILLIWGVDVIGKMVLVPILGLDREAKKNRVMLLAFLSIGVMTTIVDAVLLRGAWPLMTGPQETREYYSARQAYDYLRENIPADAVTQNNPLSSIDRPSGLYGNHQMVISDRTSYGVPLQEFDDWVEKIAPIFNGSDGMNWKSLDSACVQYSISYLIYTDSDPIWDTLPILKTERPSLYENQHYAIYACGE